MLPVRAEDDGVLVLRRLAEGVEPLAGGHVPQLDRAVAAGARQQPARRIERHVEDRTVVPLEQAQLLSGRGVPQADRLIVTGGGDDLAVRAERGGQERVAMAPQRLPPRPVPRVPKGQLAEQAGLAGRREQQATVRGKSHAVHASGDPGQRLHERRLPECRLAGRPRGSLRGGEDFDASILRRGNPASVGRKCNGGDRVSRLAHRFNFRSHDLRDRRRIRFRAVSAGLNPRLENRDLRRRGSFVSLGRHRGLDPFFQHEDQPALVGIAGHDDRSMFSAVERLKMAFEHQPALSFLCVVASQAVFPEEGSDIPRILGRRRSVDRFRCGIPGNAARSRPGGDCRTDQQQAVSQRNARDQRCSAFHNSKLHRSKLRRSKVHRAAVSIGGLDRNLTTPLQRAGGFTPPDRGSTELAEVRDKPGSFRFFFRSN